MKCVDKKKYLKELHMAELDILSEFKRVCDEFNIDYYLAYGSLLGAVRHKGFIPWDDDIDVFVKGSDYLRLEEILSKNLDSRYSYQCLNNEENYYLLWNKIRLNNTTFIEYGWQNNKINHGIFIDIFPLFDYPSSKDEKKFLYRYKMMNLMISKNIVGNNRYKSYGIMGKIIYKLLSLVPKKVRNKYVINSIEKLCKYSSDNGYYCTTDSIDYKLKKDNFKKKKDMSFEGKLFSCPSEYDEVLKSLYGDYMKLPKEEERLGHGDVYLSFEEAIDFEK